MILSVLFFFGNTVTKKEPLTTPAAPAVPAFDINQFMNTVKKGLPVYQLDYLDKLQNGISRGDVKDQQVKAYNSLAGFWKDSVLQPDLYVFFTSEAAKLVNSEKNLTFAARLMLASLRNEPEAPKRAWKAEQAVDLFEKAISLNPDNDSLKVGLGSCYVYGKGMIGDAQETMKGIQQLLQVVRKDSANMEAQLVLGVGGVISRQYDKAIQRLQIVTSNQPGNPEAASWLADAYAGKGDKSNALKWYEISKKLVNNPAYDKEVDERIKMLK